MQPPRPTEALFRTRTGDPLLTMEVQPSGGDCRDVAELGFLSERRRHVGQRDGRAGEVYENAGIISGSLSSPPIARRLWAGGAGASHASARTAGATTSSTVPPSSPESRRSRNRKGQGRYGERHERATTCAGGLGSPSAALTRSSTRRSRRRRRYLAPRASVRV